MNYKLVICLLGFLILTGGSCPPDPEDNNEPNEPSIFAGSWYFWYLDDTGEYLDSETTEIDEDGNFEYPIFSSNRIVKGSVNNNGEMSASMYIFNTKTGTVLGTFIPAQGETRASAGGTWLYDNDSGNGTWFGSGPPI